MLVKFFKGESENDVLDSLFAYSVEEAIQELSTMKDVEIFKDDDGDLVIKYTDGEDSNEYVVYNLQDIADSYNNFWGGARYAKCIDLADAFMGMLEDVGMARNSHDFMYHGVYDSDDNVISGGKELATFFKEYAEGAFDLLMTDEDALASAKAFEEYKEYVAKTGEVGAAIAMLEDELLEIDSKSTIGLL